MSKNTSHLNSLNNDKICEYCGKKLLWKGSYTRRQNFCPNAPHRSIKHLPKFGYKFTKFTLQYSVKLLFVGLIFLNFGLVVTLMLLYSIYKSIMVYSGNLKDQDWMVSGDRFPASSARTLRNLMAIIVLFPIIALVAFLFQIYIWVILFETLLDLTRNIAVSITLVTISAIIILLTTIKGLPDISFMIGGEVDDIDDE